MPLRALGTAVALALSLTACARAAAPQIQGTSPFGAQRGIATTVTVQGANLAGHPRLIAPFAGTIEAAAGPSNPAAQVFTIKVDPSVALGAYPIRIQTDDGLSNPFLFSVGQLPQVAEKEDNSAFEAAQPVPSPVVVEGQSAGNDVDFFRFPGKKGQRIVIDAQCARIGSGVDPTLRLTTADHAYVGSADDSAGLLTDARLVATLPADADYVVEISDSRYQGGGRPVYRLVIGELPMAEEVYPLGGRQGETVGFELRGGTLNGMAVAAANLVATPTTDVFRLRVNCLTNGQAAPAPGGAALDVESLGTLAVGQVPELREPADPGEPDVRAAAPVVFNGRIDPAGDSDRFALAVTPGQKLHIEVHAADYGSALDGVLDVLGAKDAVLANADDMTLYPKGRAANAPMIVLPDPALDFTVPGGLTEVTLRLRDLEGRGGLGFPYRITVTPITASFEVVPNEDQASVPRGGTTAIGVTVVRKGYNGPITLSIANPPAGLTFRPGTIGAGQVVGALSLSATADAAFGVVDLQLVGQGAGPGGPIVAGALKHLVFAQQAILPTNTLTQYGLPAAPALPTPITLDAPAGPVEVVHGYGAPIAVKAVRAADADAELSVTSLPLPPGLTVPAAKVAAKAAEGTVTVNAAPETPLGAVTIALTAKGKVGGAERTFDLPAVALDVVRPAAVELAAPSLEIKAGATVELKGKVVRKGPFKEPVTVKVGGLPAGLKADPATVAPDQSEFTLKVVADPKAAAASAGASVALAFQINKKAYPTPPAPLAVKVVAAK